MLAGPYAKSLLRESAVDEVFYSLLPALLIQGLFIFILTHIFSFHIDFATIYQLMVAGDALNLTTFGNKIAGFALYNLMLFPVAYLSGYATRLLILMLKLDLIFPPFKLNNEWYYLLSGRGQRILKINNIRSSDIYIQIDVLVRDINEKTWIYCGILDHFNLTRGGSLDRIVLTKVYRRAFADDLPEPQQISKKDDARYYNMPGVYFIIPYSQIINMNVYYKAVLPEKG